MSAQKKLHQGSGSESDESKTTSEESESGAEESDTQNSVSNITDGGTGQAITVDIFKYSCIVGFVLCAVSIFLWHSTFKPRSEMVGDSYVQLFDFKEFAEEINTIKQKFPNQTKRSWTVIKAAVNSSLGNPRPQEPAVLLFVSTSGAKNTAQCLTKKISLLIGKMTRQTDYKQIDSEDYGQGFGKTKIDLDNTLQHAFEKGQRVILIENLEKMPAQASLLLYGYCDNINAPKKDVVFLMTVNLPSHVLVQTDHQNCVETFLEKQWSELGKDKLGALMSRIANSVVVINPDNSC